MLDDFLGTSVIMVRETVICIILVKWTWVIFAFKFIA